MYWHEEKDDSQPDAIPNDIVDLSFKVSCRHLPLDHAHALSAALHDALPWLIDEDRAGVHLIHGAESGNGWIRPEGPHEMMFLSRRTRMTLRLPLERIEQASVLKGQTLDIDDNPLTLGETKVRPLSRLSTLFSRHAITENDQHENAFLDAVAQELREMGIRVKKMMCGRMHQLSFPHRNIATRSVMIDGLEVHESVKLQRLGLGPGRKFGCGLFIPHKGIAAVKKVRNR